MNELVKIKTKDMESKKLNVYQRIHEVMKEVEHLQSDMSVSYANNRGYKALSETKVTTSIRASMIKHGLIMLPFEYKEKLSMIHGESRYQEKTKKTVTYFVELDATFKLCSISDPKDFIIVPSFGHGVDSQDKAPGKAMTYAYKYAILRTFMISSGDDPDQIHSDEHVDKKGLPPTPLQIAIANADGCKDIDSLETVWNSYSELQNDDKFKKHIKNLKTKLK